MATTILGDTYGFLKVLDVARLDLVAAAVDFNSQNGIAVVEIFETDS